jgi:carbonic anhydrase
VQNNARFPGNIGKLIQPIIPAVLEAGLSTGAGIEPAVRQNVRRVVAELREDASPILLAPQAAGALMVVGAYYQLTSGEVDFFDLP